MMSGASAVAQYAKPPSTAVASHTGNDSSLLIHLPDDVPGKSMKDVPSFGPLHPQGRPGRNFWPNSHHPSLQPFEEWANDWR